MEFYSPLPDHTHPLVELDPDVVWLHAISNRMLVNVWKTFSKDGIKDERLGEVLVEMASRGILPARNRRVA